MELTRVKIENYRSVENVTINVTDRCLILLGINESGKSNILRAISAISPEFAFDFSEDSKIPVNDDNYIYKNPVITYTFNVSDVEKKQLLEKTWGQYSAKWPFTFSSKNFLQYVQTFPNIITYKVTFLQDNSRHESFEFAFNESLFPVKPETFLISNPFEIPMEGGVTRTIAAGEIITTSSNPNVVAQEVFKTNSKRLVSADLLEQITMTYTDFFKANIPSIVYWKYDQKYLLTGAISVEEFKLNPDISIPLRNIFRLAGINDISGQLSAHYTNDSAFHNLLEKLSTAATTHLKKVWKEYGSAKIVVSERNGKLSVQIKDAKNLYNFSQRSDGFKRFIAFLLLLSAENKAGKLPINSILIFDEPDISLHPSGTKYLLKEILELGKQNYAFVSSHSIFFIDKEKIDRHLIIKKEEESTHANPASHQNFAEEEVLYQALGCSIFDVLKHKNLCFEGWTDKEVFRILSALFSEDIDYLPDFLKNHGVLWSSGASKISQTIKAFVGTSDRTFYAIADDDGSGRKEREIFEKEFDGSPNVFYTYNDLSRRELAQMTLEDLLPIDLMVNFFNGHLKTVHHTTPSVLFSKEKIEKNGIIHAWESFCAKEYKNIKDGLTSGYKNRIPAYVQTYIHSSGDIEKIKAEFSFYKTYLKNKVEKIKP